MLQLINLPDIVLEKIFSNLTYDEIARNRIVCKQFDRTCKKLLNRGFYRIEEYHAKCLRAVKSQLPRRVSERQNHPLARHYDILTAVETRISMLSMTFRKYVDLNVCCFIPGKVIDEIFRVLIIIFHLIRRSETPPSAHKILQELQDISSMAIEYFNEKILPELEHKVCSSISNTSPYELPQLVITHRTNNANFNPLSHNFSSDKLNQTFKKIYSHTKRNKQCVLSVKGQLSKLKLRIKRQGFQMRLQTLKIREQSKKINDQDMQIAEMKKHLEEWEQKIGDLTAELSRAREETQKNPDTMENCKRKNIELMDTNSNTTKELEAKKRKLIVERKSSSDEQDEKFKKFLSDLLSGDTIEASPQH